MVAYRDAAFIWTDDLQNEVEVFPINARVTLNKEAKSNSLEITFPYKGNLVDGEPRFQSGQFITVYARAGSLMDRDNLITDDLIGTFKILNQGQMSDDRVLKYTCSDITYDLLSNLYTRDITDTSPNIIENIVQTINENGVNQVSVTTNIQSTRSDGSAFPDVENFVSLYKTAYECISELSQTSNTGDNLAYIFWMSPDGTFNWQYPSSTAASQQLNWAEDPVIEMKHGQEEAQTISFVIFDCGEDKNGAAILDFYLKDDAGTIKGQTKYQPMTDIAPLVKRSLELLGTYASTTNEEFVTKCIALGKARAQSIVNKVGEGLRNSTITVRGSHYTPADLYNVKGPATPLQGLRLDQIIHTFDRRGWSTQLKFKEDPTEEENL